MATFQPIRRRVDHEAPTIAPPSHPKMRKVSYPELRKPMWAGGFEVLAPFPRRLGSRVAVVAQKVP